MVTNEQYAKEYESIFGKPAANRQDIASAFKAGYDCGRRSTVESCIPITWLAEHISSPYAFQEIVKGWNEDKHKYE